MKLKFIFLLSFVALISLYSYCSYKHRQMFRPYGDRGKVYETWETSNDKFKVKIDAHFETGVYMGGAYYVFSSAPIDSVKWREFAWLRVDDSKPIPREMFHFLNANVGYVSAGQVFAVTTDGSQTWSVWRPTEELQNWEYSFQTIKEVHIETDGTGRMILQPFYNKQIEVPELYTDDYGQHWSVAQHR